MKNALLVMCSRKFSSSSFFLSLFRYIPQKNNFLLGLHSRKGNRQESEIFSLTSYMLKINDFYLCCLIKCELRHKKILCFALSL